MSKCDTWNYAFGRLCNVSFNWHYQADHEMQSSMQDREKNQDLISPRMMSMTKAHEEQQLT